MGVVSLGSDSSKTADIRVLLTQAWHERWSDVQWAINIKKVSDVQWAINIKKVGNEYMQNNAPNK